MSMKRILSVLRPSPSQPRGQAPTPEEQDLANLMAWVEDVLAYTVAHADLEVRCERSRQGPHTFNYYVRLLRGDPRKLLALGPAIRANLLRHPNSPILDGPVRISEDRQYGFLIQAPSPIHVCPTPAQLAENTRGLQIAVAVDDQFRPLVLDFEQWPVMLVIGPTGCGKTTAVQSALAAAIWRNPPDRLSLVIAAEKRMRWRQFARTPHCIAAAHTAEDIAALLDNMARKMDHRIHNDVEWPAILIVVDDAQNLFAGAQGAPIREALERLTSTGREPRIYTTLISQDAGSTRSIGGPRIAANARAKLLFQTADASAAARAAGVGGSGLQALSGQPGDCVLIRDGQMQRGASGYSAAPLNLPVAPAAPVAPPAPSEVVVRRPKRTPSFGVLTPVPAPVLTPRGTPTEAYEGQEGGGGAAPVLAPVPAPSLAPDLKALGWPIGRFRVLTEEEQDTVRRLYDDGRGLRLKRLAETVYGSKNGKTQPYLRELLGIPHPRMVAGGEGGVD